MSEGDVQGVGDLHVLRPAKLHLEASPVDHYGPGLLFPQPIFNDPLGSSLVTLPETGSTWLTSKPSQGIWQETFVA